MATLRCAIVTPERTELDVEAESLTLPMIDGELGILPGRAPLVGRLGYGTVRIETGGTTRTIFVEGGFVQVEHNVVSVLTSKSKPAADLNRLEAEDELKAAMALPGETPEQQQLKDEALRRARGRIAAAAASH